MRTTTLSRLALAAMILPAAAATTTRAAAQSAETVRLTVRPESKLSVEGTSNLHAWTCTTKSVDATIDVNAAYATKPLTVVPNLLQKVDVRVPVKTLKCGHGKMDENLYKALKADAEQTISYILGSFTVSTGAQAGEAAVTAPGKLTIAGAERDVTLNLTADRQADGTVKVQGSVPLLMTDFGIKPPTAMLGALKTGNRVVVKFDLLVGPQAAVAATGAAR